MENKAETAAVSEGAAAVAVPRHRAQALMLLVLAVVVYAADQLSKNWVVEHLPEGRTVPVLGEFLQWHFVRNPGAAFSFATGATWVFTILAAVVLAAVLWQIRRLGSRSWAVFFALLLGGVAGNLTDRLIREPGFPVGHVIDFISTPWMMPAIYNVADIGIVSAMILFVLISLLGLPIDGGPRVRSRERQEDRDDESRPDDAQSEDPQSDDPRSDGSHPDEPSSDEPSSDEPRSDDPRSEGTR